MVVVRDESALGVYAVRDGGGVVVGDEVVDDGFARPETTVNWCPLHREGWRESVSEARLSQQ